MLLDITEFATTQKITKATARNWIYRHGLPVIKIGGKLYICQEDFNKWINMLKSRKSVKY